MPRFPRVVLPPVTDREDFDRSASDPVREDVRANN